MLRPHDAFVCARLPVSALLLLATKIDETARTRNNCGGAGVVRTRGSLRISVIIREILVIIRLCVGRVLPKSCHTQPWQPSLAVRRIRSPLNSSSIIVSPGSGPIFPRNYLPSIEWTLPIFAVASRFARIRSYISKY